MAEGGIRDIFIANQIVAEFKLRRLAALARGTQLSVGIDSRIGAENLSRIFCSENETIDYVIEIDSGLNRCGVLPGPDRG